MLMNNPVDSAGLWALGRSHQGPGLDVPKTHLRRLALDEGKPQVQTLKPKLHLNRC
jgi:hypothetical protein